MNSIITVSDHVYGKMTEAKDAFWKSPLMKAVHPLVQIENSQEHYTGSSTFVRYSDICYLVTAKHCLEQATSQPYIVAEGEKLVPFKASCVPEQEGTIVDIAVMRIDTPESLGLCRENAFNLMKNTDGDVNSSHYLLHGFPSSRNKNANQLGARTSSTIGTRNLRREELSALSGLKIDDIPFNPDIHIACQHTSRGRFIDENNKDVPQIHSPRGMSGGALIYLGKTKNLIDLKPSFNLAGILVGLKRGLRYQDQEDSSITFDSGIYVRASVLLDAIKFCTSNVIALPS